MPLILGAQSATASSYGIDNSCRFNASDSAYMHRTFGTPTNIDKWTFSVWLKRSGVFTGASQKLLNAYVSGSAYHMVQLSSGAAADRFVHYGHDTAMTPVDYGETTAGDYRDVGGWYHLVVIYDSGNADADLRSRLFVNGVEPEFSSVTNPGLDNNSIINSAVAHQLGAVQSPAQYYDGYMAEAIFCDGQAYDADEFGEFNSDSPTIWQPKDPSGLTFSGTNSCWLDFKDSADLGKDVSGQGNHFTEVNFAAGDQATDSPTNSFGTMNSLDNFYVAATFTEGNNQIVIASGIKAYATGTMGPSSGKWYWEVEMDAHSGASSDYQAVGIGDRVSDSAAKDSYAASYPANFIYSSEGSFIESGTASVVATVNSYTDGDIVGVALDLDNNKLYFSKNGAWENSGDPTSGASGTGAMTIIAPSHADTSGFYFPLIGSDTTARGATWKGNFGGSPAFVVSSANQDGNGYGNFENAVPSGYYALCTKNLAEFG